MNVLKKLLNPWNIILLILVMVVSTVAHLYYGPCQTSKWHYIVQRYYCPDWITPDLEFDIEKHKRWREWHKNGQVNVLMDLKEKNEIALEVWSDSGQCDIHYFNNSKSQEYFCKSFFLSGKKEMSSKYDRASNQRITFEWYDNGNKKLEVYGKQFYVQKINGLLDYKATGFCYGYWEPSLLVFGLKRNYTLDMYNENFNFHFTKLVDRYKNGQLERQFDFNKVILRYSYQYIDHKDIPIKKLKDEEVYWLLCNYFGSYLDKNAFVRPVKGTKMKVISKTYLRNSHVEKWLRTYFDSSLLKTVRSEVEGNKLVFKVSLSDEKLYKTRHYSVGALDEIKRNSREVFVIKIHFTFEGEEEPPLNKEYPFRFEYSVIQGPWTRYKENGDIDFVQTHNKRGEPIKIEYYKNGKIDQTINVVEKKEVYVDPLD